MTAHTIEQGIEVRLATSEDLPQILSLYHEVCHEMEGTPYDCMWRQDIHPSDEVIDRFVRDNGMLIVLVDGALAGATGIDHDLGRDYGVRQWLVDVPDEDVAVIHILTVRPMYRGRGIARDAR